MRFASHITYTDEPTRITELRPRHRAYLSGLFNQGKLVLAGPFTDGSGGLFVHDAANEEEVQRLVAADPFAVAGIFAQVDTRPWGAVFANADAIWPQG